MGSTLLREKTTDSGATAVEDYEAGVTPQQIEQAAQHSAFGADFQEQGSAAPSGTTSATYGTVKVQLSTGALAGKYRIGWKASLDGIANRMLWARVYESTTATVVEEQSLRPSLAGVISPACGFFYVTLTGASRTYQIQWRSQNAGETTTIRDAHLEMWRVS